MVTKYFDKGGDEISEGIYNDHIANDEYRIVNQFQNDKVKLVIEWVGKIADADSKFPSAYPLFVAKQYDFMPNKNEWSEAMESGTTFSNKKKADAFYEDFLLSWTESYIDVETGEMIETGNQLAPPPPPPPSSAPSQDYGFTAW